MKTYGYIYITTNIVNGKKYIGQHKSKDWDSNYYGSGKILKHAINKYGIKNFTCFPLAWAWNKREIDLLEINYIAHYKPEYNIAKGGTGGFTGPCSDETRLKISEAKKGKKFYIINPMFGKHHSEESKIKMSEAQRKRRIKEAA
jgi:group I intron endonuclease